MDKGKLIYQGGIPIGYFEGDTAVIDGGFWAGDTSRSLAYQGRKMRYEDGLAKKLQAEEEKKPLPRKVRVSGKTPGRTGKEVYLLCPAVPAVRRRQFGGLPGGL